MKSFCIFFFIKETQLDESDASQISILRDKIANVSLKREENPPPFCGSLFASVYAVHKRINEEERNTQFTIFFFIFTIELFV